jgi:hypothetical protein
MTQIKLTPAAVAALSKEQINKYVHLHLTGKRADTPPSYVEYLPLAWELLEDMKRRFGTVHIEDCDEEWVVEIFTDKGQPSFYYPISEASGPIAKAICIASLLALCHPLDSNVPCIRLEES